MLNIRTPDLSPTEWMDVRQALDGLTDRGCSERGRLGHIVHAVLGHDEPAPLSPRQQAIRAFLCKSGRDGRIAEDHVSALDAYGFTRAQIEAMALIAA
jgi:hypothetical protein